MTAPTTTTGAGIRFYDLINTGDLDGLLDMVADDYVGHGLGGGGRQSLRQDIQGFIAAFPDLSYTVEDTIAEGDKVAVKSTLRATHQGAFAGMPASGNSVEVAECDVLRVRDGKIVEAWTLCDSGTLFMQIGAIPAPTQPLPGPVLQTAIHHQHTIPTQEATIMPRTNKNDIEEAFAAPGFEGRYAEVLDYTVGFETHSAETDLAPLFVGLPDDACQCRHLGYVIKGSITFTTVDGEETFTAGDAYVVGPGHTPQLHPDTELVEFSPTVELNDTMAVVMKNMEALG